MSSNLYININPKKTVIILSLIATVFTVLGKLGSIIEYYTGHYFGLFYFLTDYRFSITIYYASFLFIFCFFLALISFIYNKNQSKSSYRWLILACFFLLLAITKINSIHKFVINSIKNLLIVNNVNVSSLFLGLIFLFFFALTIFLLFKDFNKKQRKILIFAGLIFLLISIPLDHFIIPKLPMFSFVKTMASTIEEYTEMIGSIVITYALLLYIENNIRTIQVLFQSKKL